MLAAITIIFFITLSHFTEVACSLCCLKEYLIISLFCSKTFEESIPLSLEWSFNPLEEFEKDQYMCLFVRLVRLCSETIWSWTFVCWEFFFITSSISFLVIGLFKLSIASWFSFRMKFQLQGFSCFSSSSSNTGSWNVRMKWGLRNHPAQFLHFYKE